MRTTPRTLLVITLALLSLALAGCRDEPAPAYIRIRGPAPETVPPTSLVVFWASWCAPCREETPALLALAKNPPEGMKVVVFSADPSESDVRAFFKGPPPPELHLRMDEGDVAADAFGVDALPTSRLIVEGRFVARFDGPRRWDAKPMRRLLKRLLAER